MSILVRSHPVEALVWLGSSVMGLLEPVVLLDTWLLVKALNTWDLSVMGPLPSSTFFKPLSMSLCSFFNCAMARNLPLEWGPCSCLSQRYPRNLNTRPLVPPFRMIIHATRCNSSNVLGISG